MPFLIPLAPLIGAIAGAAGTGLGIYETVHAGGLQDDAAKQQAQAKLQQQQSEAKAAQERSDQQKKLLAGNLPNAISQTGGYLTNTGDLGLAGVLSGLPGAPYSGAGQGALTQFLGQPGQPTGDTNIQQGEGGLSALRQLGLGGGQEEQANMTQQTYGISGASQ